MRPSMPSIALCILLSCLLASCALPPQSENGGVISSEIGELRVYPDTLNNPVHLGEPVVFEFIPTVENIQLTDLKIDTGESGKPALGCGHNQFPCKEGGAIRSIRATHKYSKEGSYNAVLQYQGVPVAEKKIIIVEQYLTDEELCYQVSKKVAGELKKGINWVTATSKDSTNAKFAFSSLSNANFEYEEEEGYPHDVEVIYSLMQALVEEKTVNDRYVILERAPQALVRLAHESLYTADPNDSNAPLREYKKLEYGLNTFNQGEKRPISYSIKLAGVNDTRSSMGNTGHGDKSSTQKSSQNKRIDIKEEGQVIKRSHLNRPLMVAQFDTADFLVVINRLEYTPVVTRSSVLGDYYDTKYDSKAIKRTATVKVNARILDKDGCD